MSTLVSTFRNPLRAVLQDNDPTGLYLYPDAALDDAVKAQVNFGQIDGYALTSGDTAITPDIAPPAGDPTRFHLLTMKAARMFVVPRGGSAHVRTRAVTLSSGSSRDMLLAIEHDIDRIENGHRFNGWDVYAGYASSTFGYALLSLSEQSIAFTKDDALVAGEYFSGQYVWDRPMTLVSVIATGRASQGQATTVALEIGGVATDTILTLPAGALNAEITPVTLTPERSINPLVSIRWRVASAPANAADCAYLGSITCRVRPQSA